MGYTVVDVDDIPYLWGTFKPVRHHLGVTAFGFTQIDFPPDKVGSEHDESRAPGRRRSTSRLSGAGTLEIDGETVEMQPGRYVLVSPEAKRRPTAGPDGMSFLVIGGVPGGVYEPWDAARGVIVRILLWRLDDDERLVRGGARPARAARAARCPEHVAVQRRRRSGSARSSSTAARRARRRPSSTSSAR